MPINPHGCGAVSPNSSFNMVISFASDLNTGAFHWQGYGGESTMSCFTQMPGLGAQNFLSAATGMAVLMVLIRGLRGRKLTTLGNFWVDLTRSTLYILLPLSLALVSQGVVQNFSSHLSTRVVERTKDADGKLS